jgi:hypothetical protein
MERPLKHVDPAVEFHRLITSHIQEQLKAQPGILFGVVVEHAPIQIRIDAFEATFSYEDNAFLILEHILLEKGQRVILWPTGRQFIVLGVISPETPLSPAFVGTPDNRTGFGVGFEDEDTPRPTVFARAWNDIRGRVGDAVRALTHTGHYHTQGVVTTSAELASLTIPHTHTVTLPNTDSATNPE